MINNTYGSIFVDGKNIIGHSSFSYTDENNWFDSKFDGTIYHQTWNKDGTIRERCLTTDEWGSSTGSSLKILYCRMQNTTIPQSVLNLSKEMDAKWVPEYIAPPIKNSVSKVAKNNNDEENEDINVMIPEICNNSDGSFKSLKEMLDELSENFNC